MSRCHSRASVFSPVIKNHSNIPQCNNTAVQGSSNPVILFFHSQITWRTGYATNVKVTRYIHVQVAKARTAGNPTSLNIGCTSVDNRRGSSVPIAIYARRRPPTSTNTFEESTRAIPFTLWTFLHCLAKQCTFSFDYGKKNQRKSNGNEMKFIKTKYSID